LELSGKSYSEYFALPVMGVLALRIGFDIVKACGWQCFSCCKPDYSGYVIGSAVDLLKGIANLI
jgi:hypothetical protein